MTENITTTTTTHQQSKKGVLDLPDINLSEPQTFETPDTSDLNTNNEVQSEIENADIDRTSLQSTKAYAKFNNRKFDNRNEDFSDSIAKKKPVEIRTGGLIKNQNVFDILPSAQELETPLQKFQRLQYEVMNFTQEMQSVAETGGEVEKDIKAIDLTNQLADLQNQLSSLLSNDKLVPILDKNKQILHHSQIQNTSSKKLISEIESFTGNNVGVDESKVSTESSKGNNNHVTYELFYTADQSKYQQSQRLIDLEKRLAKLENLTGGKSDSIPITQTLLEIREKLSLLEPTKIDLIQQKLKTSLKDMEAIKVQEENNAASTQKALNTNEKKINEIFDQMNRWDQISQQLPSIINRMYTLRSLHQEGITFSAQLSSLEKQQYEITSLLKNDSQIMNKMDESFKSNLSTIKLNIESIEKRINDLQLKITQKQQQ
ncbi:dynactin 50 kDa subunit [Tieghemostelium lacteum]|uniref:Dynactin 50 kDa subunit n=1 Tax=Tieghemostelium lacteum TaxID=361077 RepID=A0A152A6M0_TIELA|nr:dynactin 50 kDa subunit [Tieghemostelium lacteum]|eukprot:KYR01883.1 dynactin 50 kDa subunit [Tieghemostelium lacteum]